MRDSTFESKAYGKRVNKVISIEGRVQFDLLQVFMCCCCCKCFYSCVVVVVVVLVGNMQTQKPRSFYCANI